MTKKAPKTWRPRSYKLAPNYAHGGYKFVREKLGDGTRIIIVKWVTEFADGTKEEKELTRTTGDSISIQYLRRNYVLPEGIIDLVEAMFKEVPHE